MYHCPHYGYGCREQLLVVGQLLLHVVWRDQRVHTLVVLLGEEVGQILDDEVHHLAHLLLVHLVEEGFDKPCTVFSFQFVSQQVGGFGKQFPVNAVVGVALGNVYNQFVVTADVSVGVVNARILFVVG